MGEGVPSCEMSGDVLPAIAVQLVELEKAFLFVTVPRLLIDCRIEVVVPSFSALLPRPQAQTVPLSQFLSDLRPVVESELCHQRTDGLVLLHHTTSTSQLQDCRFICIFIFIHWKQHQAFHYRISLDK